MSKEKMFELLEDILGNGIRAIQARRADILKIASECIDQSPEPGYNSEAVELLHALLRIDSGEGLGMWLSSYYGEAFHPQKTLKFSPLLKEDYEDD